MTAKSVFLPVALAAACLAPASAMAADAVTKAVTTPDRAHTRAASIHDVARTAEPMPMPAGTAPSAADRAAARAGSQRSGPALRVKGALAPASASAPTGALPQPAARTARQNGGWGGDLNSNPAVQVGKLFVDVQIGPGEHWAECSGTAVNSPNKSLVITAGHCVYDPDPDGNGTVDGNGTWYEQFMFCPGYQSGCRLGTWYSRYISTTNHWFYGTNGKVDHTEDVGAVIVSQNVTRGFLVDAVGGQGISFNTASHVQRHVFGYPANDSRWPEYSYDGQSLIYCGDTDVDDGYGQLHLFCTMTGGASGGPWITGMGANGLGYVNSVNGHKPWGGAYVFGPYFGTGESRLYHSAGSL